MMFRPVLEQKLKDIFGVPAVRYGSIAVRYGSIMERAEKNVLWVEILSVKTSPRDGDIYFRVSGRLGINAAAKNYKFGFLKERIGKATAEARKGMFFSSIDDNVSFSDYNDEFVKPTVDFTFRVSLPYDPPSGKILYNNIRWV